MSVRYGSTNLSQGSLFWHHEALPTDAKQWPEGQICRSVPHTNDRFFFLHTFLCNCLNKLQFYLKIRHTFTSAILFWCHFMTLLWRALATMLRDIHYNQYQDQGQNTRVRTSGSDQYFWSWPKPWMYLYFIIRCARKCGTMGKMVSIK